MENNNIPQGYKDSPLGVIPQEWEVKRLGEVCTHFKSGLGITASEISSKGEYPVYGGNGLRGYTDGYTHDGDYVLIGRQGALCGNINHVVGKNYISEHAIAVQMDGCNDWLMYKLDFWNLNRFSESSAQPGLSVEKLVRYKLSLPPLAEQQRIAEVLGTWDVAIEKQGALVDKLTERKRALMLQLLTGKKRLPNFSEPWETVTIGDVLNESKEIERSPNPNNRITVRLNLKGVEKREVKREESTDATVQYKRYAGQFIYGKQNLHKGAFGIIPNKLNGFESSQDIPSFDFNSNVDPIFFLNFLGRDYIYEALENISTGTGSKRIQPKDLFKVRYKFPTLPEQTAIAQILTTADREIEGAKAKLESLRSQKRGLMQQLLSGKKRIKI